MKITVEASSLDELRGMLAQLTAPSPAPSTTSPPTNEKDIHELHLAPRTERVLLAEGIRTIAQLSGLNENELMCIQKFGSKSKNEVKNALAEYAKKKSTPELFEAAKRFLHYHDGDPNEHGIELNTWDGLAWNAKKDLENAIKKASGENDENSLRP